MKNNSPNEIGKTRKTTHYKCDEGWAWGGWMLWPQGYIALSRDSYHTKSPIKMRTRYFHTLSIPICLNTHTCHIRVHNLIMNNYISVVQHVLHYNTQQYYPCYGYNLG